VIAVLVTLSMFVLSCAPTPAPLTNALGTPLPPLPTLGPALVKQGQQVYQLNCASCHGAKAEGAVGWQKPDSQGNYPAPPHHDSGHTWHHPDRVLYEAIRDGMADPLRPGSPLRMPAFNDKLTDPDIQAVVTYFKSLWSPQHRAFQANLTQQDLELTPKAATPTP